jgi:mannose/cellobiose epimerase-like protein (N-acyl-D-glucosamine 2-epimerase family)
MLFPCGRAHSMIVEELARWMKADALPFWAKAGVDPVTGLFYESMRPEGVPLTGKPMRFRVQCRQIYVLSHAAVLGWYPEGAGIAMQVWQSLLKHAWRPDGEPGFVHVLAADGSVLDAQRDSYDHAFAVLAAAWLARATGDKSVLSVLDELIGFVDMTMTDAHGMLREAVPDRLPYRQNPQMHWFEAMLAIMETGVRADGATRATHVRSFLESRFIDPDKTCVREYFTRDWLPAPGRQGQIVEPGHMAEWCWLLHRHNALAGRANDGLPGRLLKQALRYQDSTNGLLVDEGLCDGSVTKPTRRSWLQTEVVKAHLAEFEAGVTATPDVALRALAALDHYHLRKPFRAGWTDQLDTDGHPVSAPVPASILYHVFVAVAEAERVLQPQTIHTT